MIKMAFQNKSIVDAVNEKYSFGEDEILEIEIFVPKSAPGQKGTGEIIVPKELSLENYSITCAGDDEAIQALCKDVTYLDLSENTISDWQEVFKILNQIPKCAFLNIMSNPLGQNVQCISDPDVYPNLQNIVLNGLMLKWETVVKLLTSIPNLLKLHLSLNSYGQVDLPKDFVYPSLTSLHFNDNQIGDWNDIAKIGKSFPNLKNLVLMHNPIRTLPSPTEAAEQFPCLISINISDSKIDNWEELEKLNHFPQLVEARIQQLEFLESYEKELRRALILVRLPKLFHLNGSSVHEAEIVKAERVFLRHYMDADVKSQRYQELEAKHGKIEPLAQVNLKLKSKIDVNVKYMNKVTRTEIQTKWTVQELKNQLQKQIGLSALHMRIWHEESDGYITSIEELESPNLPVSRYDVKHGDELLIDEKTALPFKSHNLRL